MKEKNIDLNGRVVLVTGVAGFLGSNIAKKLLTGGSNTFVIGVDNMNDYYDVRLKEERLAELTELQNFAFVKGNIANRVMLNDVMDAYCPDVVVHLAAQAGANYSIDNPEVYMASNMMGFFSILEACRHSYDNGSEGVEHLVYASSWSVYGGNKKAPYAVEDKVDRPVSLYAATKKTNELMAYAYAKLYGIPSTGLRFFTVYGPAGRPDMEYFTYADKLCRGENIELYNFGECQRDFTYIDDAIEGLFQIMQCAPKQEMDDEGLFSVPYALYNVGNNHPETILNVVNILCQELIRAGVLPEGFDIEAYKSLVPMQPGELSATYADISPIERDFGYSPKVSLQEGMRAFAEWYAKHYCE